MNAKREQLEYLQNHAQWNNGIPDILTASEAYAQQAPHHHFHIIHWWGDLPSGFTQFDFKQPVGLAYEITLHSEPRYRDDVIEADELVLMFTDDDEMR